MAREVNQVNLPIYTGKFSFHSDHLQSYLVATNPDYDYTDPKTWPLITSRYLQDCIGYEYQGGELLPPYVAYERELVDECVAHWPDKIIEVTRPDGETTTRGRNFHHLPFVYNSQGLARKFQYMHADHYITWVSGITGKVPNTRTKGKNTLFPMSSTAFEEVLEMLREGQPDITTADTESLKRELAMTQKELVEAQQRADTAEQEQEGIRNSLEKELSNETRRAEAVTQSYQTAKAALREALEEENRQHDITKECYELDKVKHKVANAEREAEMERAITAETTIKWQGYRLEANNKETKTMKKEVKSQARELEHAKKEANTAKEQINMIRDELKKMKENGSEKRQANDEATRSQLKRLKTEQGVWVNEGAL